MGIKHIAVKATDEPGYASEWNDEHVVDSDVNFNGFSGTDVGEPINPSDIATKNYVDSVGGIGFIQHGKAHIEEPDYFMGGTVNFPEPFSSIPTLVANIIRTSSVDFRVTGISTTGFTFVINIATKIVDIDWIAIQ